MGSWKTEYYYFSLIYTSIIHHYPSSIYSSFISFIYLSIISPSIYLPSIIIHTSTSLSSLPIQKIPSAFSKLGNHLPPPQPVCSRWSYFLSAGVINAAPINWSLTQQLYITLSHVPATEIQMPCVKTSAWDQPSRVHRFAGIKLFTPSFLMITRLMILVNCSFCFTVPWFTDVSHISTCLWT